MKKMKIRWHSAAAWLALFVVPVVSAETDDDTYIYIESAGDLEPVFTSFGDDDGSFDSKGKGGHGKGGGKAGLLGGLIKPTSQCFDDFISPMTNPVFFEDPRTLTEVRFIYLRNKVPGAAGGGAVNLFAAQVRAAITDKLSIVAAKDGYATSSNALIDDGWADIAVGLKYNILSDHETQRLLSVGASYELPVGSTRTLQGNGDGEFHIYASAARKLGCDWHWISGSGFRLPADTTQESQVWYWSNHLDRKITDKIYVLAEVNWYHWMKSGSQTAVPGVEGLDLFNFGSTGVAGNNIVTGAFGFKMKPRSNMELGLAWEAPLTQRRDIIDNRLTVDCILRY
jgi:hypothetical protein